MRNHSRYLVGMLVCLLVPAALYAAGKVVFVNSNAIGRSVEIVGKLGTPIGRFVTVEGKKGEAVKGPSNLLFVEKLNGKPLEQITAIEIENIEKLPESKSYVLKGYETGRMVGTPDEVRNWYDPNKTAPRAQQDMGWEFKVGFVVVEVVSPAPPKLKAE